MSIVPCRKHFGKSKNDRAEVEKKKKAERKFHAKSRQKIAATHVDKFSVAGLQQKNGQRKPQNRRLTKIVISPLEILTWS